MKRQKPVPLPQQYSADVVRSDGDSGRVFVDGMTRRTEANVGGMSNIVISRPDKRCLYTILPNLNGYMKSPLTEEMLSAMHCEDVGEAWEFVGEETLDGTTVRRFNAFLPGQSRPYEVVYVQPATGIRVRTVTLNRNGDEVLTVETRNVVMGPPPKEMFEIPEGMKEIRR